MDAAEFDKLELDYLNSYIRRTPELVRAEGDNREDRIVPAEASKFFGCSRLTVDSTLSMPADKGFYALVTLGGEGVLRGDFEDVPLKRGKSVFIPRCLSSYVIVSTSDTPDGNHLLLSTKPLK